MSWPDMVNGLFEACGGLALCANIKQLLKDKQVKGIHWGSTLFFTSWGLWNCFYYPHLDQWFSFLGGIFIATANIVWLALRVHYSKR